MSVRKRGSRYEVRWTEAGHKRSRTFNRKGDADAYDLDVKRRKQLGSLAPQIIESRLTLAEFMEQDWWPRYALPNLAADTRRRYLEIWGGQLLDRVGDIPLREITPLVVEDLLAQLAGVGASADAQRRALTLLRAILKRAVVRGLIPTNPVMLVTKPKLPIADPPQPLAPETVEQIRRIMRPHGRIIVSLLAYAGLRPGEMQTVYWDDLANSQLYVRASKTNRARRVDVLAPLMQDLREWRLAASWSRPGGPIVPRPSGGAWTREDWSNWRTRVWTPAAKSAGVTGDMRPYRLRGSFVSLLLWEGRSLPYVAEQAGHSVATLARHYAGVVRELEDRPRVPASEAIRMARDTQQQETG